MEIVIAGAMLGGLSLAVMKMTTSQQKSMVHMESRTEESALLNEIRTTLIRKAACEQTLGGRNLGASVPDVKDDAGNVRFSVGQEINTLVRIQNMEIINRTVPAGGGMGDATFRVSLERMRSNAGIRAPRPLELMMQVTTNATGTIQECFADTENTIETAKLEACQSIGGEYISEDNACNLASYDQPAQDNIAVSTSYLTQWGNWENIADKPQTVSCPEGQYVTGVNIATGSVECSIVTGGWPEGSYCIFRAGGSCPPGFTAQNGQARAIKQYATSSAYLTPVQFGDSSLRCHGGTPPCTYPTYSELHIHACCK